MDQLVTCFDVIALSWELHAPLAHTRVIYFPTTRLVIIPTRHFQRDIASLLVITVRVLIKLVKFTMPPEIASICRCGADHYDKALLIISELKLIMKRDTIILAR